MTTESRPRPAWQHDRDCTGVRWMHHMPWTVGAPVMSICAGCTAVRRIDGERVHLVAGGPAVRGGAA